MLKLAHRAFVGVVYEMPCESGMSPPLRMLLCTACQLTAVSFRTHCSFPGHNGLPPAAAQNEYRTYMGSQFPNQDIPRNQASAALCSIWRTVPGLGHLASFSLMRKGI